MTKKINPPKRLLLGPGPSEVSPQVLKAMTWPLLGHLDPEFIHIMDEVKEMTRQVFQTSNELTSVISGTGSAGMEACFVNLLEPGDQAMVCVNGAFGNRMCDIVERCGASLIRIDAPWGRPFDPDDIYRALQNCSPKVVAIVHAETSTGVLQPLEIISKIVHDAGALLVVDAVTSLGGSELCVDRWNIDACYSGTQKCLSAPPGLSPITFSPAASKVILSRKSKIQSWYLDMSLIQQYWAGAKRAYHHTAPISMIYAMHEALRLVLAEGLEPRINRHHRNHLVLKDGLEALDIKFLVDEPYRLPMLNVVKIPAGLDDTAIRRILLNEYSIEIGNGLGEFAGKVWRIGLMGESSNVDYVEMLLSALSKFIR